MQVALHNFIKVTLMGKIIVCFILIVFLTACENDSKWVCKSVVNNQGQTSMHSENIETGEIGAYSKCKE